MIIFLSMNLIVGVSAFLLNYRIFKFNNFIDSLLSLFLLYFAQIVSGQLLLGILNILYLENVILFNLAILLIIWSITRNKKSSFSFKGLRDALTQVLNNKVILFATCVILGFGLVKICINLVNPPFGWDCLNYHFTFPVEWIKNHNLGNPIVINDDPFPPYYPINGSLLFLWLILPFKNVFLADLAQVPFFILAFLAAYNISRKISINRENSFYAAALFLLIPNFFKQLEIAYVDVMVGALFLICLNYLFSLNNEFSGKNIFAYSISLGLFLGTKTIALPYSILLTIPFVYLLFKNINKFYLFIIPAFVITALGGFTYIRNFIITCNPLYPLDFKLWGKSIFKGAMDTVTYGARFKLEDYRLSKLLFHEGLGVQTLIFILPSIFLALPLSLLKRKKTLNFNLVYFLVLPVLIYLVYRYIIPLANTRYLYPLLGIGIIIGLYTAQILNIPRIVLRTLVVICLFASMSELASRIELVASVILTFLLFFILPVIIKKSYWRKRPGKPLLWLACVFLIIILMFLEKNYIRNEYPRYAKMVKYSGFWPEATRAWEWLNKNTSANNIAYVGRPVPFPLYGANFKNNVYYISVNKTEPAKLHYFPDSRYHWDDDFLNLHQNLAAKGNYRGDADYSVWLNNLLKRNTDYLFIYSLHQTKEIVFPLEDRWVKANPDRFSPVFTSQTIHIYKVLK